MKNPGVSNGVYLGVAVALINLIMYFVSPKFMLSTGSWFSFLLYILFMVKAGREEKSLLEGYASFGEILKPTMICYIIGSLIATVFSFVLINYIDPSLMDTMKDIQIEAMDKMAGFLGEDAMEEAKDTILENENIAGFGTFIMGWAFGLIIPGLIFALIISAILKNAKPEELA